MSDPSRNGAYLISWMRLRPTELRVHGAARWRLKAPGLDKGRC